MFYGTGGVSWREGSLRGSFKRLSGWRSSGACLMRRRRKIDLGVHPTQLRNWVKQLADDPQHAFPGHGQMKPEQLEIAQLKREVAKLKAERDILKKAAAYFAKESM